jgi:hypothetical protein
MSITSNEGDGGDKDYQALMNIINSKPKKEEVPKNVKKSKKEAV